MILRERRSDFRAGIIAAQIANFMKDKETEPTYPMDFFPQHQREKETFSYRIERRRQAVQKLNAMKITARQAIAEKQKKEEQNG